MEHENAETGQRLGDDPARSRKKEHERKEEAAQRGLEPKIATKKKREDSVAKGLDQRSPTERGRRKIPARRMPEQRWKKGLRNEVLTKRTRGSKEALRDERSE